MIKLNNVNFRYGSEEMQDQPARQTLSNINLEIESGQVIIITGESGCGKTTVGRLVNGLCPNFYPGEMQGNLSRISLQRPRRDGKKNLDGRCKNANNRLFTDSIRHMAKYKCKYVSLNKVVPQSLMWHQKKAQSIIELSILIDNTKTGGNYVQKGFGIYRRV